MVARLLWHAHFERLWSRRTLIWLMGVRRTGKTILCQSLPGAGYHDCELPSVRRQLEDPEAFWSARRGQTVVLDEVHRLENPSEILKIAADHFPDIRVAATGSSTLGASAKFRDTLAGRKSELLLTPMCSADLTAFGGTLLHRLRNGGLPPFFLDPEFPERDYVEWLDAYWARDILELFRLERRHSFLKFAQLLFAQSGGIFEAASFAQPCEVSRPTIQNYLSVLAATFVAVVLKPYHSRRSVELVAAPKVYSFDTGFVCIARGWHELRREDLGHLWEHYVLNEMRAVVPQLELRYWRDKQQHEIDFIALSYPTAPPIAIECKWSADAFDPGNLKIFRRHYPQGENFVVAQDVSEPFIRRYGSIEVRFVGIAGVPSIAPAPASHTAGH